MSIARVTDPHAEVRPAVDLVRIRHAWELACVREELAEQSLAEVRLGRWDGRDDR